MLRFGVTIVLAAITLLSSAQLPGQDRNATDSQGRKQGLWVKTWPNSDKTRYIGQFKDDIPIGKFQYFDEDGLLTSTMEFKLGSDVSVSRHFHPSGELMAKGSYRAKLKDSTWHYFDESGQLRKIENFDKGHVHGEVITFFRDGGISDKRSFDQGEPVGEWTEFHTDGKKRALGQFKDGKPEGEVNYWYANGRPEIKGKYADGLKEGGWKYYNKDGTLQMQVLYDKGDFVKSSKENGVFKDYYPDDQIKNQVTWKNGKKEGKFTEYFADGIWEEKTTEPDHALGLKGGEKERVLSGQTVRIEGEFKNDKLHGTVKTYNEKGRLVKEENYVEGELQ